MASTPVKEVKGKNVIIRLFLDKKSRPYFTKQIGKKKKGRIKEKNAKRSIRSIKAYSTRERRKIEVERPTRKPSKTRPIYKYAVVIVGAESRKNRLVLAFRFPVHISDTSCLDRAIKQIRGAEHTTRRNVELAYQGSMNWTRATDNMIYDAYILYSPPEYFNWVYDGMTYKSKPYNMTKGKRIQIGGKWSIV